MNVLERVIHEALEAGLPWVLLAFAVERWAGRRQGTRRLPLIPVLFLLHAAMVLASVLATGEAWPRRLELIARLLGAWVTVGGVAAVLFDRLLPPLGVSAPAILRHLATVAAAAVASLVMAGRAGVDVTSVFATSAVLTAVIGFAMQDTLGNAVSGLALQLDDSIREGDWIQVDGRQGWVVSINWRCTTLETRDWETILIPNAQITKAHVLVLGRREGRAQQVRRTILFDVDNRHLPTEVIRVVTEALRAAPIPMMASDPPPKVECLELRDGLARYAALYWLTDLSQLADSPVRERLVAALIRAGMSLAAPASRLIAENSGEASGPADAGAEARRSVVDRVELFSALDADDRAWLSARLQWQPFAPGEVLAVQGEVSSSLVMLHRGLVSVRIESDGHETEVARLGAGEVFGEMALLTGEPRRASIVAVDGVSAYRLDHAVARELMARRPELAEAMARLLLRRREALEGAMGEIDAAARSRIDQAAPDLVARVQAFFGLRRAG